MLPIEKELKDRLLKLTEENRAKARMIQTLEEKAVQVSELNKERLNKSQRTFESLKKKADLQLQSLKRKISEQDRRLQDMSQKVDDKDAKIQQLLAKEKELIEQSLEEKRRLEREIDSIKTNNQQQFLALMQQLKDRDFKLSEAYLENLEKKIEEMNKLSKEKEEKKETIQPEVWKIKGVKISTSDKSVMAYSEPSVTNTISQFFEDSNVEEVTIQFGDGKILLERELVVAPSFKKSQETSMKENRIKLFRPFFQQKPVHGREVGEVYSWESLVKALNKVWSDWKQIGIFVGKKYDGATVQVHKDGKKIKIWTEDGNDITNNVPSIVKELQAKPGDWVVIGEVEYYKDGVHQPRADTAGIINAKTVRPEGSDIRISLYDKLYHLGTDLHKLTYEKRRESLKKIKDTAHIKVSRDEPLVKNEKDLIKEARRLSGKESSEGAMFKKADMPYDLKLHPSPASMLKFKTERFLISKVIAKHLVKGATKTWYYDCALKDSPYVGRTYNTSIDAKVGDHVKVVFVDISEYHDPSKKVWFNWWAPRVVEITREALDDSKKAHKFVMQTTGRVQNKKLPKKIAGPAKPETAKGFAREKFHLTILGTLGEGIKPRPNHQKESSLLIEWKDKKLMIDCGKTQRNNLDKIKPDYLLITHGHPDHVGGLKEGAHVKTLLTKDTLKIIKKYPLEDIEIIQNGKSFELDGLRVLPVSVYHSLIAPMTAFRIMLGDKTIFYCPDVMHIKNYQKVLKGVDLYIGDGSCLYKKLIRRKGEKAYGHTNMLSQVKWCQKAGVKKIIFTHFGEEPLKYLRARPGLNVRLQELGATAAYDNMELISQKDFTASKRFVQQHHWRGKSVHVDWRFEMNDHLIGFTLADAFKDEVKEPIDTMGKARAIEKRPEVWKVDWSTGEEKTRRTPKGEVREKIWCDFKAMQPKGWLTMSGVTPARKIKPIPGGTKEFPGVFYIFNKGTFDLGAQKPYFKEFFIHSPKVKGRVVFRQVAGLKEAKKPLTWLYWKADDQTPYALSRRAERAGWLPKGYSALPSSLEKKIPDSLNYWKKGLSRQERLRRRSVIRKQFKEQIKEKEMAKGFLLTRRHWRGQLVIRKLPVEDYHIRVAGMQFHLDKNPIWKESVSALLFKGEPDWFKPGKYPPLCPINPNKKIPAFIEKTDSGDYEIERKEENLIQIRFKGKKLKGMYIFKRTSGDIWAMMKQKAPLTEKSVQFSFKNFTVKPVMSKELKFPYPVHAIAFAEGTWHGTFYPWDVVKKASQLMVNAPLVVEHKDGFMEQVGQVTKIKSDDKKKWIEAWGYLYDTEPGKHMATLIANDQVEAVSARVQEWVDEEDGREVCKQIVGWPHLAFVRSPEVTIAKILNGKAS